MSSRTDIEMAHSQNEFITSDFLKPTNGDLLKMHLEMKEEMKKYDLQRKKDLDKRRKFLRYMFLIIVVNIILVTIDLFFAAETLRGLYITDRKGKTSFRCGEIEEK